jgi:hypothetical protein
MTREEVITLCEYVAHACPQQRFDKYTPNVWADILAGQGYTFDECRTAVISIKRRQVFVDTSEIIAEVKRIRNGQREIERREEIIEPARRRQQLHDARPVREQIDAIFARHGRRELLPAGPAAPPVADKPRHQQIAELDARIAQETP